MGGIGNKRETEEKRDVVVEDHFGRSVGGTEREWEESGIRGKKVGIRGNKRE